MIENLKVLWDNRDIVQMLFTIPVLYIIYMLPSMIAVRRRHPQRRTLLWVNFFLGWTGFGWILVLRRALNTATYI